MSSGNWDDNDWAVIQTRRGQLVVYHFDKYVSDEPKTGTIQVYKSWPELEAAVPAKIFEEALLAAGIKKPSEYREVPLKL
jgi:hypothetical protein